MVKVLRIFIFLLAAILILAACQAGQPVSLESTATPTVSASPTSTATSQPEPSPVASPSPTLSPVQTETQPAPQEPVCFVTGFAPFAFIPDSQQIVVRGEAGVHFFNLETLQEESYLQAPQNLPGFGVALSPDGETLAWALPDFTIQLIRVSDGELLHTLVGHTDMVTKLRFSPAGDRLYSASHDSWVRIWNLEGEEVHAFQPTGADNLPSQVLGIGLSSDGSWLASLPFDGPVKVWDATSYTLVAEIGGTGGFDTSDVAFSPDGQYIAADLATGLSLWRVSDRTQLLSAINSMAFAFSPDGRYLAYADIGKNNAVILSSPDGTQIIRTFEDHAGPVWELFFSPDGAWLMSADGIEIRIWDVETGQTRYVGKSSCP